MDKRHPSMLSLGIVVGISIATYGFYLCSQWEPGVSRTVEEGVSPVNWVFVGVALTYLMLFAKSFKKESSLDQGSSFLRLDPLSMAFFCGAYFLFGYVYLILEPVTSVTSNDGTSGMVGSILTYDIQLLQYQRVGMLASFFLLILGVVAAYESASGGAEKAGTVTASTPYPVVKRSQGDSASFFQADPRFLPDPTDYNDS